LGEKSITASINFAVCDISAIAKRKDRAPAEARKAYQGELEKLKTRPSAAKEDMGNWTVNRDELFWEEEARLHWREKAATMEKKERRWVRDDRIAQPAGLPLRALGRLISEDDVSSESGLRRQGFDRTLRR